MEQNRIILFHWNHFSYSDNKTFVVYLNTVKKKNLVCKRMLEKVYVLNRLTCLCCLSYKLRIESSEIRMLKFFLSFEAFCSFWMFFFIAF